MYQLINRLPFFYGWTILFAAGSSMVVRNATASLTLAVFIFPMSEDLGWSRTLIAGAASLGGLVATVASPLVGWALDRYGARTILTVSVLILGLSTVSLAWATVPIAFYLAYGLGRVIFASPLNIGRTVCDLHDRAGRAKNAHVVEKIDADGFFDLVRERLARLP